MFTLQPDFFLKPELLPPTGRFKAILHSFTFLEATLISNTVSGQMCI